MSFWAVARTIASRETFAAEKLVRAGYEILAPRAKLSIAGGKLKIGSLFPGYLFVRVFDDRWYDARWCEGVLGLIMAGDRPARCPNVEIEKIMQSTTKDGLVRLPKHKLGGKAEMAKGQNVRILTGSFTGLNAIYQGTSARERIQVLLDLLGRRVPVELARDDRIEAS